MFKELIFVLAMMVFTFWGAVLVHARTAHAEDLILNSASINLYQIDSSFPTAVDGVR